MSATITVTLTKDQIEAALIAKAREIMGDGFYGDSVSINYTPGDRPWEMDTVTASVRGTMPMRGATP